MTHTTSGRAASRLRVIAVSLGSLATGILVVAALSLGLTALGLAQSATPGPATPGPTVSNVSFEQNLRGWRSSTSQSDVWDPTWQRSTAQAHDGKASAAVTVTRNAISGRAASYLATQATAITPGTTYSFTAWARTTKPAMTPRLVVAWYDAGGHYLPGSNIIEPVQSTPADRWGLHTVVAQAPAGAASVELRLEIEPSRAGVTGTTWWDEIGFAAAAAATPTAAAPGASPAASPEATNLAQLLTATTVVPTAPSSPATPKQSGKFPAGAVVVTNTSDVRLRTGPSLQAEVVETLVQGTELTISGAATTADGYVWWPVADGQGQRGYVAETYLVLKSGS